MSFEAQLLDELKTAMKAKDALKLTVLRALKTAITNAKIENGSIDSSISEADAMSLVRKQMKQRQDASTQFKDAGRLDLAEKEDAELEILSSYLPTPLTPEEINVMVAEIVKETGASSKADMGKVMKLVQEKADGRADGKLLSQEVMKHLS